MLLRRSVCSTFFTRRLLSISSRCYSVPLNENEIKQFDSMMKRRFFFVPSGKLYEASSGLFDFGPHATAIKWKLLDSWKRNFIDWDENIFPVESSSVVSEDILEASGHVAKFQDVIVKDTITSEYVRVDHLIQEHLEKQKNSDENWNDLQKIVYSSKLDEIKVLLKKLGITKNPATGNEFSDPLEFNLMFKTQLGVEGKRFAYLRPELAQGIFTNFPNILRQSDGSLPFGGASIGNVYRNETSARQGLLRTREFTLAEIEFFFHPENPSHPRFTSLSMDTKLPILSASQQQKGESHRLKTLNEIQKEHETNEIFLYYMDKAFNFLVESGIDKNRIRFRQHLSDEMAHYAKDCWDIEIQTSQYGWIECVGIADRSNYDLSCHISKSPRVDNQLMVFVPFEGGKSIQKTELSIKPNQPNFGKTLKDKSSMVSKYLSDLSANEIEKIRENINNNDSITLEIEGNSFSISNDMLSFEEKTVSITGEHIVPHVIEPSFGINRILYCLLEHSFKIRESDETRTYLSLPPHLSPIICEVLVMKRDDSYNSVMDYIVKTLCNQNIHCKKSVQAKSRSIGKSYSIIDEVGTPFAITIDEQTITETNDSIKNATVTIRERNSMEQERIPIHDLQSYLQNKLVQ